MLPWSMSLAMQNVYLNISAATARPTFTNLNPDEYDQWLRYYRKLFQQKSISINFNNEKGVM